MVLVAGCAAPTETGPGDAQTAAPAVHRACPAPGHTLPFEHAGIQEASGIARSLREACVYWVHDDSGAGPVIYAMDGAGANLGEAWLEAPAIDWEDIASFTLDGSPYLLVADTGNNGATRDVVTFLVVSEPPLPVAGRAANLTVGDVLTITVRYPAAPFDIEAVAVDAETNGILVVSKGETRLPTDPSGPNQSLYTASLSRAMTDLDVTLELQTLIPGIRPGPDDPATEHNYGIGGGRTTGMDLRPDRGEVAILTYREILVWARGPQQGWVEALAGMPRAVAVPDPGKDQMEGLAYSHEGTFFLVSDEQGERNSELTVVPARGA